MQLIGLAQMPAAFGRECERAWKFGEDLGKGMVKTVVFGLLVTWVAVFQGYDAPPTAEGMAMATTRTGGYIVGVDIGVGFFTHFGVLWRILMRMRTIEISVGGFVLAGYCRADFFGGTGQRG